MLHLGDLFDVLPTLPENSVDACVTDPPYGIGFMGKEWDTFDPKKARAIKKHAITVGEKGRCSDNQNLRGRRQSPAMSPSQIEYDRGLEGQHGFQQWTERWAREVLRVLKPGAHLLVCGAPRSFHRMACGVEDAGFEIRDCLSWLYGQGFPKSLNLGRGQGTALKPGWEPIVLARKPIKTGIRQNVSTHGTGGLNIDGCRIGTDGGTSGSGKGPSNGIYGDGLNGSFGELVRGLGRWPANVVLDEDAAVLLDEQTAGLGGGGNIAGTESSRPGYEGGFTRSGPFDAYSDRGGASRFYYVAKPSREERDYGCDGLDRKSGGELCDRKDGSAGLNNPRAGAGRTSGGRNIHPTVKPVELMRWLVKLVAPIGGTVLDPFAGSGTTGMACRYEQRGFIGIEREAEYVAIAECRIAAVAPLFEAVS